MEGAVSYSAIGTNFASFVKAFVTVGVNCFVLISGYFLCEKKFRISRILKLWIKVFVISVGFAAIFKFNGLASISLKDFLYAFVPIGSKQYWFITCYVGMLLFTPLLNVVIEKTTKKQLLIITIFVLAVTSFWENIMLIYDTFGIEDGYRFIWFISLYLVAAYIKKYVDVNKIKMPIVWYLGACIFAFLFKAFSPIVPSLFYRYNSITMVIASVGLFITFAKMNIGEGAGSKIISFFAPLTFGVYLIHENNYFRDYLWNIVSPVTGATSQIEIALRSIVVVFAIFIACALADFIITKLLDLIVYKRGWYQRLMARVDGVFDRRLSE